MTLYKDMLTKSLKRSRKTALTLLQQLSRAGGIPEPVFEHEVGGTAKRPSHYARVRFRVPSFLHDPSMIYSSVVVGSGRCSKKVDAKSLAALEVIFRLENDLQVKEGFIATKLEEFIASQKQKQEEIEALPVSQQIPGVSWETVPMDMCFGETSPAGRRDRIEFFPSLTLKHSEAFMAAKAITLTSREGLPIISVHQNNTSEANQCYANIRVNGHIEGVSGARRDEMYGVESSEEAALHAFERIADNIRRRARRESFFRTIASVCERKDSSFGMAKLFVSLPKHQFQDLKLLLEKIQKHTPSSGSPIDSLQQQQRNKEFPKNSLTRKNEPTHDDVSFFRSRLDSFRSHQKTLPLPVDSVEADIPHDAMVTIVQGGTGSGKVRFNKSFVTVFYQWHPSLTMLNFALIPIRSYYVVFVDNAIPSNA